MVGGRGRERGGERGGEKGGKGRTQDRTYVLNIEETRQRRQVRRAGGRGDEERVRKVGGRR